MIYCAKLFIYSLVDEWFQKIVQEQTSPARGLQRSREKEIPIYRCKHRLFNTNHMNILSFTKAILLFKIYMYQNCQDFQNRNQWKEFQSCSILPWKIDGGKGKCVAYSLLQKIMTNVGGKTYSFSTIGVTTSRN